MTYMKNSKQHTSLQSNSLLHRFPNTYLGLFILSILILLFVSHNYFLYEIPILQITELENQASEDETSEVITQTITGIIKNGEQKGSVVTVSNTTTFSGVFDEQIHKNSELLLSFTTSSDGAVSISILGIKRDKYLVFLLLLLINLLFIIGGKKGVKTCISLLVNTLILLIALYLFINEWLTISIFIVFLPIAILFIIASLSICNGFDRKTLAAIISSIVSLLLSFLLAFIVLNHYKTTILWGNIDYIDLIRDYEGIFYLNILLSGLGAIMDISITMSSSLNEIIEKNKKTSYRALRNSGQEISQDILGTMINVMLYTCYIWIIPLVLLACKNNMTLVDAIQNFGQIEMIRVLTSSISIVLAIPISLYISLWILKGMAQHD